MKNRMAPLQETGDPVYAAHVAMDRRPATIPGRPPTHCCRGQARQTLATKAAKDAFDTAMRTKWTAFPGYPGFPGIDNVTNQWLKNAGSARTKIAKLMDTDRFQKLGFPDVGLGAQGDQNPDLLDVSALSTGHNTVRVGPGALHHITDPKIPHNDYASQLAAKGTTYEGGTTPIPVEVFWFGLVRQAEASG